MLSHIQRSPYLITPKISRWCQSHAPTTGPTALQNLDASFVSLGSSVEMLKARIKFPLFVG